MNEREYDRIAAVSYAHQWARVRNPAYYNYDKIGGDCTNFASQCIFAGAGVMNIERDFGWYYKDANDKSPSWTGVEYLWRFMTSNTTGSGPYGKVAGDREVLPGDIVQLSFDGRIFSHTQVVVDTGNGGLPDILIAAHTYDSDFRPLNTYEYEGIRFLHIAGVRELR